MLNFQKTTLRCVSSVALLVLWQMPMKAQAPSPSPSEAWKTKDLHYHDKKISLLQAMQRFAEQTGKGYFIDGEPLQKDMELDFDLTAKDALDKIAEAFDYTWTLSRHQVILLNKRFKDPDDLPQMQYREMRHMAQDILSVWPAPSSPVRSQWYPFDHRSIYAGNALYRTLTAEQLAYLQTGQKLTYDQLSEPQQDIIALGINNELVGTTRDAWDMLGACMDNLPRSVLQYRAWRGRPDAPNSATLDSELGSLDCVWSDNPRILSYYRVALHPTEAARNTRSKEAGERDEKRKTQEETDAKKK